jgi:hypothetical protein
MRPPLPPEKIAKLLAKLRSTRAQGALITWPIVNGIGGSWVRK